MTRSSIIRLAALAAVLVPAVGAVAQDSDIIRDYPTYASRCSTAELMEGAPAIDPCQQSFAHFGLTGPAPLLAGEIDVTSSGSILPRNNVHDTKGPQKE